jgi:peptide/nickel transport system permease protein
MSRGSATDNPEEKSVFDTVSDRTLTRQQRARRRVDRFVNTLQILWSDPRTLVASLIVLFYVGMGTIGILLVPAPNSTVSDPLVPPLETMEHPLGTTGLGVDLWALTVHATPFMLKMMIAGALFTAVIAVVIGLVSGYRGGTVDRVLSTVTDIAITVPGLPLFIVLAALLQPTSPYVVGVILSVNRWAGLARQVRSEALSIREEAYVEASEAMGMSQWRLLYDDFLPNIMPFVTIRFANAAKGIVYASVALYFLGLLPASGANWGVVMNKANTIGNALSRPEAFHWILVPMMTVVVLSWALATFAQGADRLFNPRIRTKMRDDTGD